MLLLEYLSSKSAIKSINIYCILTFMFVPFIIIFISFQIIAQMFRDMRDRLITKTLSKTTGRYVTVKPRTPTVAANFSESLLSLIDTMSRCNPYFVRCIKPNSEKAAMTFNKAVVLDQLRYTGMLETIRIRKLGFPIRVKFPHFIER